VRPKPCGLHFPRTSIRPRRACGRGQDSLWAPESTAPTGRAG
jgi:hypothetical protein